MGLIGGKGIGYAGGSAAFRGARKAKAPSVNTRSQLEGAAARQFTGGGGVPTGTSGGVGGTGGVGGGGSTSVGSNTAFTDAYNKILARLESGGTSLEADLAEIEAGKRSAIAAGEQNVVSSGLSGTTIMAGVPIAAEKTAGLQRLRARGTAEDKYLQALTSFANLAFQAKEGELNRAASAKSQQVAIANRPPTGSSMYVPESERQTYGAGYDASGNFVGTGGTSSSIARAGIGSGYYSEQYPSLYGQGGQLPPVPDWTS